MNFGVAARRNVALYCFYPLIYCNVIISNNILLSTFLNSVPCSIALPLATRRGARVRKTGPAICSKGPVQLWRRAHVTMWLIAFRRRTRLARFFNRGLKKKTFLGVAPFLAVMKSVHTEYFLRVMTTGDFFCASSPFLIMCFYLFLSCSSLLLLLKEETVSQGK